MTEYLQQGFTAARVPAGAIALRPPLRKTWSKRGMLGNGFASELGLVVEDGIGGAGEDLVAFDTSGEERWRERAMSWRGIAISYGLVYASAVIGGESLLVTLEQARGRAIERRPWPYELVALLSDRGSLIGRSTLDGDEGRRTSRFVLQQLDKSEPEWSMSSSGPSYWEVACDSRRIFICGGDSLLAIDLDRGTEVWSTDLAPVGGKMSGIWQPMVTAGKVVILTRDGTTAFDAETGRIAWCYTRQHGSRMIYEGRVYIIDQAYYTILELQSGRELVRVRILDEIERKWGFDDVGISTGLLVSETHAFFGDGAGRLYALERNTGEPVWYDRPKGTRGYLAAIPAVAGNRLYMTTFSVSDKQPRQLYCYEGAG